MSEVQTATTNDDHEYVEYEMEFLNGEVVSCQYFGEGRQTTPIIEPVILKPITGDVWPRGLTRIERMIRRGFRKLQQTPGA